MKAVLIISVLVVSAIAAYARTAARSLACSHAATLGYSHDPEGPAYDARFTFVRLRYTMTVPDPYRCGPDDPPWHHDYPRAETNLMHIIGEVTSVSPYQDGSRILGIGDPELMKYPVAYMSEPGYWSQDDQEVKNLHDYLAKGGFIIFDDFGGRHWANLALQMARVWPRGRWIQIDASQPIFHVFFDINSLDNVRRSYRGQPIFFGMFEDNDPKKRMIAIANYDNDVSEDWEWSGTGFVPVPNENESYKFGVDYMLYGLTH